ncbi:hypothetical protein FB451DRAFT_1253004 [Mycena latifolia]|nr:hypothetical protein FB451DRAFT_1253004 [Mycena latifolia]
MPSTIASWAPPHTRLSASRRCIKAVGRSSLRTQTLMQLSLISILAAVLAATGAHAQNLCATVPSDVARQLSEMQAFNNRVPPPSKTSVTDCTNAKSLKKGIDAYRTALAANPSSGCIVCPPIRLRPHSDIPFCAQGVYANLILTDGFNPQYSTLGKFVASCPA